MLNPGTRPASPPVEGLADTPFWTNRDAVQVTELPGSLVVVGGGPIGCELAQVFARFGVQVTVVQHGDRLLPANEPEAARCWPTCSRTRASGCVTGSTSPGVVRRRPFTLTLDDGEELTADKVLVAAGRIPNLDDLGLDTVGLDPAARTIDGRRADARGRRTASGRSATSPATARSRTCRCTSPPSPAATSSARTARRRRTTRCRTSPSPTPRSAASG